MAAIAAWPNPIDADRTRLANYFRSIAPSLEPVRQQLAATKKQQAELEKQIPETLITLTQAPREIRVLARGNWMDNSGDVVQPSVPHFLTQLPGN